MIPSGVVRGLSPSLKGLGIHTRLACASGLCDPSCVNPAIDCGKTPVFRSPRLGHHARCFSASVPHCQNKKKVDVSYFNEFYTAVTKELNTIRKDETLNKWQKATEDPVAKRRATNKWIFMEVINIYIKKNEIYRRGHCDFIDDAVQRMKDLGIERELSCYKHLMRVFPQNEMIVKNYWTEIFAHYPKQQTLAMEVMDYMAGAGVLPDTEFVEIILQTFGYRSDAFKKVRRMIYWMPKFRHLNPYKLPHFLPGDTLELALLALKKMTVDINNYNTVWKIKDESLHGKETFAASGQSPEQQELLAKHPGDQPLYVEGAYKVWLRDTPITYFVLKAESEPFMFQESTEEERHEEEGNVDKIETMFDSEESGAAMMPAISPHHQEDGTVFAICITGTSTKDSLIAWIRCLQEKNPNLEKTPIVFTIRTPDEDALVTADTNELATQL